MFICVAKMESSSLCYRLPFLRCPCLSSRAPCRRPVWQDRPRSKANPRGKGSEGRPPARPSRRPFLGFLLLGRCRFSLLFLPSFLSFSLLIIVLQVTLVCSRYLLFSLCTLYLLFYISERESKPVGETTENWMEIPFS